jgi:hypothetical protein
MKPPRCKIRRKVTWACLIRPAIGYLICLSLFSLLRTPTFRRRAHYNPQWDNWAVVLKSGHQVALERVPVVLETYLGSVRNKILIGETSNVTVSGTRMVGVDVTVQSGASLQSMSQH